MVTVMRPMLKAEPLTAQQGGLDNDEPTPTYMRTGNVNRRLYENLMKEASKGLQSEEDL